MTGSQRDHEVALFGEKDLHRRNRAKAIQAFSRLKNDEEGLEMGKGDIIRKIEEQVRIPYWAPWFEFGPWTSSCRLLIPSHAFNG